jgi:hypothetical protein
MVDNSTSIGGWRLSSDKEEGEKVIPPLNPTFFFTPSYLGFTYIYPPPTILPWLGVVVGSEQAIERVEVEEKGKEGEGR